MIFNSPFGPKVNLGMASVSSVVKFAQNYAVRVSEFVRSPLVSRARACEGFHETLGAGAVVATGAIVLGLVAGELRRRSGSLLPAVILHALFNAADAFWSQR